MQHDGMGQGVALGHKKTQWDGGLGWDGNGMGHNGMRYSGMRSWIGTRWAQWDGRPCQSPVPPTGGYLAHSLAIMTDAAHLLTDVGSMAVSLFSLWVSTRPPTTTMTFGWHRSGEGGGAQP